jgi:hypothetical protein
MKWIKNILINIEFSNIARRFINNEIMFGTYIRNSIVIEKCFDLLSGHIMMQLVPRHLIMMQI